MGKLASKAIKYGDDISTDLIIAGKYTKTSSLQEHADHAMEDLDPKFREKAAGGAFVVAGMFFGCGSSREGAPVALKAAGVVCVVAKSFARIFYRNAVNIGLPIVECDTDRIRDGDVLEYEIGDAKLVDRTTGESIPVRPMPGIMIDIFKAGDLCSYFKETGGF
jgi:3-isopropylmalate/(R)-2-methylmalate dehydratase small subunit